jgi:hypothetical protein
MTNNQLGNLNDEQLFYAAHKMYEQGGGFASAIAQAFFRADKDNRIKLLLAFEDLFQRFAPSTPTQGETA